jgi:nucleoside-diphosphate-sugar epimerase
MRVFLAGASGAVGRRLVPLLLRAGHEVTGTTRSAETGKELERAGVTPAVLDVFDPQAVTDAMRAARAEVVIHQLTDLPREFDETRIAASYPRNARIRTEGTRNLIAAAQAALLAVTRGAPGVYNIADDDGAVSIAKARSEIGFEPKFRLP